MRKYFISLLVTAGAMVVVSHLVPSPAAAQSARGKADPAKGQPAKAEAKAGGAGKAGPGGGMLIGPNGDQEAVPPPVGPTPRMADGKPDLTGVLFAPKNVRGGEPPSMTPWAEAVLKSRNPKDDPELHCLPAGVPRMTPYPYKFVQIPKLLVMLFEANIHSYRQVFLDRGHDPDVDPSWYGESVGKWEGDTLVVDTVGFNDKFWFDFAGHPHTEDLHTIERYTRPDLGHLQNQITIIDPKAYTKPWVMNRVSNYSTNWEIHEYICNEFNVDTEHVIGR